MAGDWIKIEHVTPDKPEVIAMAGILEIDQELIFAKLCRLWIWADQQLRDGHAVSVTKAFIDFHVRVKGFAEAMRKVGWLSCEKSEIIFPNFERHNGDSAKNRALSKDRMSRHRYAKNVTEASPEKRREELNSPYIPQGGNARARRKTRTERAEDAAQMKFKTEGERAEKAAASLRAEMELQRASAKPLGLVESLKTVSNGEKQ